MKKLIGRLALAIIAALLGYGGWSLYKNAGPRERVTGENGTRVLVEELSYYNHGDKVFGRVFKPGDENGNFPDSLGTRPLVLYLHAPLKSAASEAILRSVVCKGVIGFSAGFHGGKSEIAFLVKKLASERFVDRDLIFLVTDGPADEAAYAFARKRRNGVAGHLAVDASDPKAAAAEVAAFLERNGAMK